MGNGIVLEMRSSVMGRRHSSAYRVLAQSLRVRCSVLLDSWLSVPQVRSNVRLTALTAMHTGCHSIHAQPRLTVMLSRFLTKVAMPKETRNRTIRCDDAFPLCNIQSRLETCTETLCITAVFCSATQLLMLCAVSPRSMDELTTEIERLLR